MKAYNIFQGVGRPPPIRRLRRQVNSLIDISEKNSEMRNSLYSVITLLIHTFSPTKKDNPVNGFFLNVF